MGAVLESDIYCEAICDGRHLHPGTVRFLIKMKGIDRMVAITDSIMAAGLPDGSYKLGVNDVVVKDGDAKLKDGTRAGSNAYDRAGAEKYHSFYRADAGPGAADAYDQSGALNRRRQKNRQPDAGQGCRCCDS